MKCVVYMSAARLVFIYPLVKIMKIARQVNTVLELAKIVLLDNVVATTGNVHLGHATRKREVILVGLLQST